MTDSRRSFLIRLLAFGSAAIVAHPILQSCNTLADGGFIQAETRANHLWLSTDCVMNQFRDLRDASRFLRTSSVTIATRFSPEALKQIAAVAREEG